VQQTLFKTGLAWANSIFGPSYNYEAPKITFSNGDDIPPSLVEEMRTLTADLTEDIDWHSGDIALIDNTRVMHGRRTIMDPGRLIFNALSYVDARLLCNRCTKPILTRVLRPPSVFGSTVQS
jgi:hypothetical protein